MDFKKELGTIVLIVVIALVSVWPAVRNNQIVPDFGSDAVLISWILHQPLWSFSANIFYPYRNVLAYSEMFKISKIVSAGNFARTLVIGQLATLLVVYFWWRNWFRNPWAAALGAISLGLSQIRWEYQVHLQMWSMQYWLLGVVLVISAWKGNRWQLYAGALLLGLQAYESLLPIYFALVLIGLAGLIFRPKFSLHWIWAGLVMLAVLFPAARTYLGVSRQFNFVRDIRESAHNSMGANELAGKFLSPGLFVLLFLALTGLDLKDTKVKYLLAVAGVALVLSLGPVLKWQNQTVRIFNWPIPLPYAAAYYLVPGFQAFRTPSRWVWIFAWAASGLVAAALSKKRLKVVGMALVLLVAVVGGTGLHRTRLLPQQVPQVYQWLKDQPGQVVLELPIYTIPHEATEVDRMYYSLYHGKTLVNGFSGFIPPSIYNLAKDPLSNMPPGVDYVISHQGPIDGVGGKIYQDGRVVVYKVNSKL